MDGSNISVIGNVFPKGKLSNENITFANTWVALCKIKSNTVALADTEIRGKFFIRIYRMGGIETWYRDIIISVISATGISDSITMLQRGQKNSTGLKLVLHKEGSYWVLYARGSNIYDSISYQLLYAPYPSFLTPIHEKITVSTTEMDNYNSETKIYPNNYYSLTVTPVSHMYIDINSFYNDYFVDDDGIVNLNMGFYTDSAMAIANGTVIATISRAPLYHDLITFLSWWTIGTPFSSGVIPAMIKTDGTLVAKGAVPTSVYIGINVRYKTVDNSL